MEGCCFEDCLQNLEKTPNLYGLRNKCLKMRSGGWFLLRKLWSDDKTRWKVNVCSPNSFITLCGKTLRFSVLLDILMTFYFLVTCDLFIYKNITLAAEIKSGWIKDGSFVRSLVHLFFFTLFTVVFCQIKLFHLNLQ